MIFVVKPSNFNLYIMKKNAIFQLILCLLFPTVLSAQAYKSFDLNKYYTPDIIRNALDLSFLISDNYRSFQTNNDSIASNMFDWELSPIFTRHKNTRNKVSNLYINGNTNGEINDEIDRKLSSKIINSLAVNYNLSLYSKKQRFLKLGLYSNYQNNYERTKNSPVELQNYTNENNNYNLKPTIGIGIGRIESVRDARQAVYIIDELSKKQQLSKNLSDKEVFEFAQTISKVKNKRFLDARLRKIEEITTIDSFLLKNNFLTNQAAAYFTTLYDFWENGDLFERNSGKILEFSFSPGANFSKLETTYNNTNQLQDNNEYFGQLNLAYVYHKQLHLDWQQSLSTSLGLTLSDINNVNILNQNSDVITNLFKTEGTFNFSYTLSYFPSTRSRFSLWTYHSNSLALFENIVINDIEQASNNTFYSFSSLNATADYYFSPQLRVSGNIGIGYSYDYAKNNNYTKNNFAVGAGVTFNYSFF